MRPVQCRGRLPGKPVWLCRTLSRAKQIDLAVFAFNVIDFHVSLEHRFHHLVFIVAFEGKDRQVIEQPRNGARITEFRTGLVKAISDVGDRAIVVVGQTINDDQATARPEAFVTRGCKIFSADAFGLVNRFFNNVRRHLIFFGFFNHHSQRRIGFRVGNAVFGNHVKLLPVFGIDLGFLASRLKDRDLAIFEASAHSECLC